MTTLGRIMAHPARVVANEFITRGLSAGHPLTPLQIIKLVYFAHGWMLATHKRPLVRERFEAWKYGPVVPDLYHAMKMYRAEPVTDPLPLNPQAKIVDGLVRFAYEDPRPFDESEQYIIDSVYGYYGGFSGTKLIQLTHRPDAPWYQVWFGATPYMTNRQIQKYFESQLGS